MRFNTFYHRFRLASNGDVKDATFIAAHSQKACIQRGGSRLGVGIVSNVANSAPLPLARCLKSWRWLTAALLCIPMDIARFATRWRGLAVSGLLHEGERCRT